MMPTNEDIKVVSEGQQKAYDELVILGDALEQKKKAFAKTQARFQEMVKLAREGKQDEALELFAPQETADLRTSADAVNNKQNELNRWSMKAQGIDRLIQMEKVKLEAAKMGVKYTE
jgi:hypothetical protein